MPTLLKKLSIIVWKIWMRQGVSEIRCRLLRFTFRGKKYQYFCHPYNFTWLNERTVEVPIVWNLVEQAQGKKILELGNVLSHYFPITHDVVDKYEKAKGVLNKDIVDYNPKTKYDLIVSISTLEHVGWDEKPREKNKAKKAVKKIRSLLAKGGTAIITAPAGYNHDLSEMIKKNEIGFDEVYFLKRISSDNRWVETTKQKALRAKYGKPHSNANAIIVGFIYK